MRGLLRGMFRMQFSEKVDIQALASKVLGNPPERMQAGFPYKFGGLHADEIKNEVFQSSKNALHYIFEGRDSLQDFTDMYSSTINAIAKDDATEMGNLFAAQLSYGFTNRKLKVLYGDDNYQIDFGRITIGLGLSLDQKTHRPAIPFSNKDGFCLTVNPINIAVAPKQNVPVMMSVVGFVRSRAKLVPADQTADDENQQVHMFEMGSQAEIENTSDGNMVPNSNKNCDEIVQTIIRSMGSSFKSWKVLNIDFHFPIAAGLNRPEFKVDDQDSGQDFQEFQQKVKKIIAKERKQSKAVK